MKCTAKGAKIGHSFVFSAVIDLIQLTADERPESRLGRAHPRMASPYVSMHCGGHDADERRFVVPGLRRRGLAEGAGDGTASVEALREAEAVYGFEEGVVSWLDCRDYREKDDLILLKQF